MEEFKFEYGIVEISHRLNFNKAINHEKILLQKCIRMALIQKVKTASYIPLWEMQILYYDDKNKIKCGKYDLDDFTFQIKAKGNMTVEI